MRRLRSLSAAMLILAATAANAQQTIVGAWASGGRCSHPLSRVAVGPLSLSGEDWYCEFDKVSRAGDTVSWGGKCNFSENGFKKTAATAQLRAGKLFYRFDRDAWSGPLQRCPN
jgi:hypothetical protein